MSHNNNENRARRRDVGQETAQNLVNGCASEQNNGNGPVLTTLIPQYLHHTQKDITDVTKQKFCTEGKSQKIFCELGSNGIDGDKDY